MSSINPAATTAALPSTSISAAPEARRQERFAQLDTDGNGALSATEFAAAPSRHEGCHGGGRSHDDFAAAVRGARIDGGGGPEAQAASSELASLRTQVETLTSQLQAVLAQLGLGSTAEATSAATSDATAGAASLSAQPATAAAVKEGYQYTTDAQGNTFATDEAGNVFAVDPDGTGTLVQEAASSATAPTADASTAPAAAADVESATLGG